MKAANENRRRMTARLLLRLAVVCSGLGWVLIAAAAFLLARAVV